MIRSVSADEKWKKRHVEKWKKRHFSLEKKKKESDQKGCLKQNPTFFFPKNFFLTFKFLLMTLQRLKPSDFISYCLIDFTLKGTTIKGQVCPLHVYVRPSKIIFAFSNCWQKNLRWVIFHDMWNWLHEIRMLVSIKAVLLEWNQAHSFTCYLRLPLWWQNWVVTQRPGGS